MYRGAVLVIVLLCISAAVAFPWPEYGNFPERGRGGFPAEPEQRERVNFPERERGSFPERDEFRGNEKPHTKDDATAQWDNDWDEPVFKVCESGEAFYRVKSTHDNGKDDRLWEWSCRSYAKLGTACYWSGYINYYDDDIDFECDANHLMTGTYSVHSNYHEDRQWDFKCCALNSGSRTSSCRTTDYINEYDGWMDYTAPSGAAFVGTQSEHSNKKEDRRWKIKICDA